MKDAGFRVTSDLIEPLETFAWRIVEDQSRSSTRKMVSTVIEHEILEQMLEDTKPKIKYYGDEKDFIGLHYLLFTPFRYPPLKYGTRFGKKTERNLFYSSLELKTALCEKAFHRLNFLLSSEGHIGGGKTINCTAFKINIHTGKNLNLCKEPFQEFRDQISSPVSYYYSQELGQKLREDGVESFISYSARSKEDGKNLNIFTPSAFVKKQSIKESFKYYTCYATKSTVEFYSKSNLEKNPIVFSVDSFNIDGRFPLIKN